MGMEADICLAIYCPNEILCAHLRRLLSKDDRPQFLDDVPENLQELWKLTEMAEPPDSLYIEAGNVLKLHYQGPSADEAVFIWMVKDLSKHVGRVQAEIHHADDGTFVRYEAVGGRLTEEHFE